MSHAYAIEAAKDAPVLCWRLHETTGTNAEDISGNGNDGTYSGSPTLDKTGMLATISSLGETSRAVGFDGSDDKVKLASAAVTAYPATIVATVKADAVTNATDFGVISIADEASDNESVVVSLRGNGSNVRAQCNVRTGGADQIVSGSYDIAVDTFVEVAVRLVSATDRKIYVNGLSVGTDTTSTTFPSGLDNTTVGALEGATVTFHSGDVAEVRIYDSDIGEDRIRAQYSVGQADQWYERVVLRNDPAMFCRLNETGGTTADDLTVHGNDLTYSGGITLDQGTAIADDTDASSIIHDGVDGIASREDAVVTSYPFTMEGWLRRASGDTGARTGLVAMSDNSDNFDSIYITLNESNGKAQARVQNDGTGDDALLTGTTTISVDTFYYVALVAVSSTDFKLYVNGVLEDTFTTTTIITPVDKTAVGARYNSPIDYESGQVGDAAIYPSALSPEEIYAHYQVGITSSRYARQVHSDKPAGYWRLGEPSGTTAADESRNGNDLALNGTPTLGASGALTSDDDTAITFDGTDDEAFVAAVPVSDYPFTLEILAKTPASTANDTTYIPFGFYDQGINDEHMGVELHQDGSGNIVHRTRAHSNAEGEDILAGTTVLSANTFAHLVSVFAGAADRRQYTDGEPDGTDTTSIAFDAGFDELAIGVRDRATATFFAGTADEAAIYDYALTLAQVRAHNTIIAASSGTTYIKSLSDTLGMDDTLILALASVLSDGFGFSETIRVSWLKQVAVTLGLDDALDDVLKAFGGLSDALGLDDAPGDRLIALEDLADSLGLDDAVSPLAKLIARLAESISFLVTITLGGETYLGVAVNPRTQAVTTYTGWNFNSFCELDGVYLGASDDGVFELAGADDDGTDIDAVIELAVTRLGSNELKRLPEMYLHMQNDGPVVVQVIHTEDDGSRKENWYEVRETSSALKTKRVKMKKGERSIDWGARIRNQGGGTLILDAATLVPFEISRRLR